MLLLIKVLINVSLNGWIIIIYSSNFVSNYSVCMNNRLENLWSIAVTNCQLMMSHNRSIVGLEWLFEVDCSLTVR